MKRWIIGLMVAAAIVAVAPRASAQRGWAPPDCELSKSHFLVNSANLYLQNAAKTQYPDQRQRDLRDANRVLNEALQKGRDQDPAVWYFLGRYYEEMADLDGADSAFTRAQQLAPQCTKDIQNHRRRLWVPILNKAVGEIRTNDPEAAKATLRNANRIYTAEPPAFFYLAQVFGSQSVRDSAIFYFERALALAQDTTNKANETYADIRETASFNIARLFHMNSQLDSAVYWYQQYRQLRPSDPQAIIGQASALESAGRGDEAVAMYDSVLMRADSMETIDLFQAGVAMFRAHRLKRAAEAFEKGLERNPYYRDALYNLANTYLSMAQEAESTVAKAELPKVERQYGEQMTPIVHRLVAIDPASLASLRLLATAYQLRGLSDSTLLVLEKIDKMPFDLTVSSFVPSGDGKWDVRGLVTNAKSEPVTVPPITFDFLNEKGEVVQSVKFDGGTIDAEAVVPFIMAPVGAGIAAWRYSVGS